jgi:hypothetical protein
MVAVKWLSAKIVSVVFEWFEVAEAGAESHAGTRKPKHLEQALTEVKKVS